MSRPALGQGVPEALQDRMPAERVERMLAPPKQNVKTRDH
jgi:hypothetical protein